MSQAERVPVEEVESTPADLAERTDLIPIFIMGKRYDVPSTLTIQKAFEFAGYQLIRGCGCRGGICGACATVYRMPDSPKIYVGLACQSIVQPHMYLAMVPFFPANRAVYNLEEAQATAHTLMKYYPELAKCMGCNTCTKSCPMDIQVMEYISAALRGDVEKAAELSFSCVMCGICASRCPAELAQYNIGILCRRITGRHIWPPCKHLQEQIQRIESGRYDEPLKRLMTADLETLRKLYVELEMEPHAADEMWEPKEKQFL